MLIDPASIFKELLKVGARPALRRAQRQVGILRTLKTLGLNQLTPSDDFEAIYAYALVEHLWGQPPFVIRFFEDEAIRIAFRSSFESGDWTSWRKESDQWMLAERTDRGRDWLDYDPRQQLDEFSATFLSIIDSIRSPKEVHHDRKIDGLREQVELSYEETVGIGASVEKILAVQADLAALLDDRLPEKAEAVEFHSQVFDWLRAVGNRIEHVSDLDGQVASATIEVPVRRGRYERVLVHSVHREAGVEDVTNLEVEAGKQRVDEAWLVASRRVTPGARTASAPGLVVCYTFDELIDQDADFEPYLNWLDEEVERRGIKQLYVDLAGRKEEFNRAGQRLGESTYDADNGWIDGYVDTWLDDSSKGHLSLLGEFGTGKSWFCLHYAWVLAQRFREAKRRGTTRPRLPIFIPLRDYAKAVNVESLFSEFFFRRHELNVPGYSAFEHLNRMGRLLLIFDGFDEMAARIDRQAMVNNFWELARAVVPGAKVLLTCRTEHFPAAREGRALLSAELRASTSGLTGDAPQFELMHMLPWDDAQVHKVLMTMTDEATVTSVESQPDLMDLLKRPVMAELVLDALPDVHSGAPVDTTLIYLYAVRRKMSRDIRNERTFTSMSEKMFFLCELSWEMLSTDQFMLNYRLMPERIRSYFGGAVATDKDLDHWHYDMMGQTMLIRNSEGDYFPAHRSLTEFFVAFKIVAELGLLSGEYLATLNEDRDSSEGCDLTWDTLFEPGNHKFRRTSVRALGPVPIDHLSKTLGSGRLTRNTISMMVAMMGSNVDDSVARLITTIRETTPDGDRYQALLGGNCATLAVNLRTDALAGVDLSGTSISGAMFDLGDGGANLTGTNFDSCLCTAADFERALLVGASFRDSDMRGALHVGYTDECVRWMERDSNEPSRLVMLTNEGRLVSFGVDDESLRELTWLGHELFEMETSPDGRYLVAAGPGVAVVDTASGEIRFSSSSFAGAVFICEVGETVPTELWVRGNDMSDSQMTRIDLRTGVPTGDVVEFGSEIAAGFWLSDSKSTVFILSGSGLVYANLKNGRPFLTGPVAIDLESPGQTLFDDAQISFMHGAISFRWTAYSDDGLETRVAAIDGKGGFLSSVDYLTKPDLWSHVYRTKADRAFELGSSLVTFDPDGVRVHHSGGSHFVEDRALTDIQRSSNENEFLFADRYGNVGVISVPSLERRYLGVWGSSVTGADFTNARGLSESQLLAFRTMGAKA